MDIYVFIAIALFAFIAYVMSYDRARQGVMAHHSGMTTEVWHALPIHFGVYGMLRSVIPGLLIVLLWSIFRHIVIEVMVLHHIPLPAGQDLNFFMADVRALFASGFERQTTDDVWRAGLLYARELAKYDRLVSVISVVLILTNMFFAYRSISASLYARHRIESWGMHAIRFASVISVAITALIFLSVVFEAGTFFSRIPLGDFIFGTKWSPQTAIRADQAGASGAFGVLPLLGGTLLITLIALVVAVPIGILSAIFMSEYASRSVRRVGKPMLEILAGIPTVVYGFFAVMIMAPFLRDVGQTLGLDVASESALAAGLVMGVMIIPLVSSLSDDALKAVPQSLRDASLGLGATQSETIRRVLIPAALPGIVSGILLAASRAIGETMIVVMAAGLSANLTINPLESVTTITVQIVALLVGDQEFGSTKTLAAFALGLTLFLFTLMLNVVALMVVRKYRQVYE